MNLSIATSRSSSILIYNENIVLKNMIVWGRESCSCQISVHVLFQSIYISMYGFVKSLLGIGVYSIEYESTYIIEAFFKYKMDSIIKTEVVII